MTNDPYRGDPYGAGGSDGDAEATWSRPSDAEAARSRPEEPAAWSRPEEPAAWSRPEEPAAPWPQDATRPPDPTQTPGAPPEWPPAAAAASTVGPQGPPPYQVPPAPPYQAPPYQGPYQGQPAGGPAGPGGQRPTNPMAIAALVCSLAGIFTAISAPVGAVLGHLSLRQIRQTGEEGESLAKAAIWVGWIITGLVVAACCAVLVVAIVASRTAPDFAPR